MKFQPSIIDTSDVILPEGITEIVELLAKNTHEVWASGKIREGYVYGIELNEVKKTHPSLVPYDELAESQKDYDRNTLLETIRLLIKLGYDIERRR
ncbi:MAG: Ryanodine receptor Ryr [Clostridiales bacterium]|jgi:hypothetical protein|nr:Ryanodine receptor Ryr [Clostridiales bacterium]